MSVDKGFYKIIIGAGRSKTEGIKYVFRPKHWGRGQPMQCPLPPKSCGEQETRENECHRTDFIS
jgi:hypothetical protein